MQLYWFTSYFGLALLGIRKIILQLFPCSSSPWHYHSLMLKPLTCEKSGSLVLGWCQPSGIYLFLYVGCSPSRGSSLRLVFLPIKWEWQYQNLSFPLGLLELFISASHFGGISGQGLLAYSGYWFLSHADLLPQFLDKGPVPLNKQCLGMNSLWVFSRAFKRKP